MVLRLFWILLISVVTVQSTVSPAGESIGENEYEPKKILVGVTEDAIQLPDGYDSAKFEACRVSTEVSSVLGPYGPEDVSRVFRGFNPEDYNGYDFIPPLEIFLSIRFSADIDARELARKLEQVPGVLAAEPNFYIRPPGQETVDIEVTHDRYEKDLSSPPNDDMFWGIQDSSGLYDQWNLHDDGSGIGCQQAWTYSTGDSDVRIGVLEDGIWTKHTDLVVVGGFRLAENPTGPDLIFTDADTNIYYHHATQSAGIIAATTNNGFGIAGIAGGDGSNLGCSLYDFQVERTEHSVENWARALRRAVDPLYEYDCDVISLSVADTAGSPSLETLRAAVLFAYSVKANVVASKGNNTTPPLKYPAGFDDHWMTAVAAYDSTGSNIYSSNAGCTLDVVAPGEACPTTSIPGWQVSSPEEYGAQILSFFGASSCATPHVAGAIGLLRSYIGNDLRAEDYASIIALSADDPVDGNPHTWGRHYGHGRLDIGGALANAASHEIYRLSTTNTAVADSDYVAIMFMSGPHTKLTDAIRYKVQGTIHFDPPFDSAIDDQPLCWGPGLPPYPFGFHGYSASLKNYREPFHEIVPSSVSVDSCDVFTYTYKLWNKSTQAYTDWYPARPSQIPVAVCALGTKSEAQKSQEVPSTHGVFLYPNPFNAHVKICYNAELPGELVIDVVNVRGVRVRQLRSGWTPAGDFDLDWDGTDNNGRNLASGVYFVRVASATGTTVTKLTLAK